MGGDTGFARGSQLNTTLDGGVTWADNGGHIDGNGALVTDSDGRALDVARSRALADQAVRRQGPQTDYTIANTTQQRGANALQIGNLDRNNGLTDRNQQLAAIAMQQRSAMGGGPSQAMAMSRGVTDQGLQGQLSAAAGARGGVMSQAAAQGQTMSGLYGQQQQGLGQVAALRANEMTNARGAYAQGTTDLRGADYNAMAQDMTAGQAYGAMGQQQATQATQQADLDMRMREQNQKQQQFYESQAFNVNNAQLQAATQNRSQDLGHYDFEADLTMRKQADDFNTGMALAKGGAGIVTGLVTRAEGGPVESGQPYLVGERGPEMVVPHGDATVIPADQTPQVMAMYEPPGQYLQQTPDGHAYLDRPMQDDGRPSLSGSQHHPSMAHAALAQPMPIRPVQAASTKQATRKPLTPDELRAAADKLEKQMRGDHEARMAQGPAVRPDPEPAPYPADWMPAPRRAPSMGEVALMGGREDPYL